MKLKAIALSLILMNLAFAENNNNNNERKIFASNNHHSKMMNLEFSEEQKQQMAEIRKNHTLKHQELNEKYIANLPQAQQDDLNKKVIDAKNRAEMQTKNRYLKNMAKWDQDKLNQERKTQRETMQKDIDAILTPQQKEQFAKMKEEHKQHMQNRSFNNQNHRSQTQDKQHRHLRNNQSMRTPQEGAELNNEGRNKMPKMFRQINN